MSKIKNEDIKGSIIVLTLYILQGLALGVVGCVPLVLNSMGVEMEDQAIFSLAMWPFSIKILWAPIVDSISFGKFGWRKPWIILAQMTVGLLFFAASLGFESFVENGQIALLTGMYFLIIGMVTVQDISVDGWACSLLSQEYVGMTANLQLGGQLIGAFSWNIYFSFLDETIGYVLFLKYVSLIYLITTVLVLIFVKDTSVSENNSWKSVAVSYTNIFKLLSLRPIIWLVIFCLTSKVGFAPHGEALMLKMRARCVEKKIFSKVSFVMKFFNIATAAAMVKFTRKRSLITFLYAYPFYMLATCCSGFMLMYAEQLVANGSITWTIIGVNMASLLAHHGVYLSSQGFFFYIADESMGGVYMTLLNSMYNMGGVWVETVSLKTLGFIDRDLELDKDYCDKYENGSGVYDPNETQFTGWDSYYSLCIFSLVVGTIWYALFFNKIKELQDTPVEEFRLEKQKKEETLLSDEKEKPSEDIVSAQTS
ncbi:Oidioi.mRNA.OKI2018_I69.PAR.g9713.t1.cds [Oikopleura dioica]|uniref:Oidioi.mRNA.OKI2018_I69.PAR.g9713.t1.cds n=1 Tax=Oikopleura dioica TaxID=34765 RepID=A0ABN7RQL0_OIKDI|nr:Oidioi.mRNA.OKI2018_I69.PAR.g9713.t1.cds [Oikopleura dioica]